MATTSSTALGSSLSVMASKHLGSSLPLSAFNRLGLNRDRTVKDRTVGEAPTMTSPMSTNVVQESSLEPQTKDYPTPLGSVRTLSGPVAELMLKLEHGRMSSGGSVIVDPRYKDGSRSEPKVVKVKLVHAKDVAELQ